MYKNFKRVKKWDRERILETYKGEKIKGSSLKDVPKEFRDISVCLSSLNHDPMNAKHFPKDLKERYVLIKTSRWKPEIILALKPEEYPDAIRMNPKALDYLENPSEDLKKLAEGRK